MSFKLGENEKLALMLFKSRSLWHILEWKTCLDPKSKDLIDVQMIENTKKFITRIVQKRSFEKQFKTMTSNEKKKKNTLKRKSSLQIGSIFCWR